MRKENKEKIKQAILGKKSLIKKTIKIMVILIVGFIIICALPFIYFVLNVL